MSAFKAGFVHFLYKRKCIYVYKLINLSGEVINKYVITKRLRISCGLNGDVQQSKVKKIVVAVNSTSVTHTLHW